MADPLAADVQARAQRGRLGQQPAAGPVGRLEHHDVDPAAVQVAGRDEAGHARADDGHRGGGGGRVWWWSHGWSPGSVRGSAAKGGRGLQPAGGLDSVGGAGVPGRPGGRGGHGVPQGVEEGVLLRPVGAEDDDLSGDAVEAAVVQALGGHVLRLEAQVVLRPLAGDDDDRDTPPSSLVIGLVRRGVPAARAAVASSPTPHTTASWVASLPVMWTAAMPGTVRLAA